MSETTVGQRYQIVIPKAIREQIGGLKPGEKVIIQAQSPQSFVLSKSEPNWVEKTCGLANEAWKRLDVTQYLEDLRNDWS